MFQYNEQSVSGSIVDGVADWLVRPHERHVPSIHFSMRWNVRVESYALPIWTYVIKFGSNEDAVRRSASSDAACCLGSRLAV
jgi:hypothetical protein